MSEQDLDEGETLLGALVGLITGLIKSKIPDRFNLREEAAGYGETGEEGEE